MKPERSKHLVSFVQILCGHGTSWKWQDIAGSIIAQSDTFNQLESSAQVDWFNRAEALKTRKEDFGLSQIGERLIPHGSRGEVSQLIKCLLGVIAIYMDYCDEEPYLLIRGTLRHFFQDNHSDPKYVKMLPILQKATAK